MLSLISIKELKSHFRCYTELKTALQITRVKASAVFFSPNLSLGMILNSLLKPTGNAHPFFQVTSKNVSLNYYAKIK